MGFIADIFTGHQAAKAQTKAADKAAQASQYATDQQVSLNRDIFNKIWNGTQVQRDAGDAATRMMAQIMGLNLSPQQQAAQPTPGSQYTPPPNGTVRAPNGSIFDGGEMPTFGGGMFGKAVNALAAQRVEPTMSTGQYGAATPVPQNALQPTAAPATQQPFDVTAWLRSTPGYEANFKEGQRAMAASQAARGGLLSGDAGREAIRYGQQYGDRIFGDQFNRLAAIAGAGQTATSQGNSAGQSYAGNVGNALQQNAANLGSSYQNQGNTAAGMWGGIGGSINNALSGAYSGYKKGGWSGAFGGLF